MTNRPAYTLYVERYSHNAQNIEDGLKGGGGGEGGGGGVLILLDTKLHI